MRALAGRIGLGLAARTGEICAGGGLSLSRVAEYLARVVERAMR